MTSHLHRTETLNGEKDLGTSHPKQLQCDRRDEGNERRTLTKEPLGKNEDCTGLKGTKKIFNKVEGTTPANEDSNNMLTPTYKSEEEPEKSHPKDLKIGPQKEKDDGCELTDETQGDDMDCTQLDSSPEPRSEAEEKSRAHKDKDIPSPGFNNEEECEDDEGDCNQQGGSIEGVNNESWHSCVFSWLWKALVTILSLLTKGAEKNKNAQIKRPPYDTIVSNSSDGPVANASGASLEDIYVYIQKLERRVDDLERMQFHSKGACYCAEKMTQEKVQHDSQLKEINNLTEKMEKKVAQCDLHLKEWDDREKNMEKVIAQIDSQLKNREEHIDKKMAQLDTLMEEMKNHGEITERKMAQCDPQLIEMENGAREKETKMTQISLKLREVEICGEMTKKKMALQDLQSQEMSKRVEKIERIVAQHDSQLQEMDNCGETMKKKMTQPDLHSKEMGQPVEKIEREITQLDSQLQDVDNRGETMKKKMAQQDMQSKETGIQVENIERKIALHDLQLQDMNNLGEMLKKRVAQDDFLLKEIIHRTEKLKKEMAHYNSQLQEMGDHCESMQEKVAQHDSHFEEVSNRADRMERVLAQHDAQLKEIDPHKERMEKGMRELGEKMNNHYALICMQDEKTVHLQRYFDRVLQQHMNNCRNVETQIGDNLNDLIVRIDTLFAMSAPSTPAGL